MNSGTTKSNTSSNIIEDYIMNNLYDYSNFYDDKNNSKKDINNYNGKIKSPFKCKKCKGENAIYYCKHCIDYFCENCYINNNDDEALINHIFVLMDENKIEKEEKKNKFLELFINMIKNIILKCDIILKNENQTYFNPNNLKAFLYPFEQNKVNFDAFDNQIDFLIEINNTYELIITEIDNNMKIPKNDKEIDICSILHTSLENMFGEKKIHFKNDSIDDDNLVVNEKIVIGEDEDDTEEDNSDNAQKNDNFYYLVNRINKQNYMIEDINFDDIRIEKLAYAL